MSEDRSAMIRKRLVKALNPEVLEIIDESAKHAGHAGAASGGGHFIVQIVSTAFEGENLIQRHRMVYDAVDDIMHTEIHALSIQAKAPDES
ncbi:MAG: BolA family transcriptional regulator [Halobacteria archaeon]|nr:BolA family transcriptional regulator [Halobacteria archaeon]